MFSRPGLSQISPGEEPSQPPGQNIIKRHKSLPPRQRRKSALSASERGGGLEGARSYYYGDSDTDNRPAAEVKILSSLECFIHFFIFYIKTWLGIYRNNEEIFI